MDNDWVISDHAIERALEAMHAEEKAAEAIKYAGLSEQQIAWRKQEEEAKAEAMHGPFGPVRLSGEAKAIAYWDAEHTMPQYQSREHEDGDGFTTTFVYAKTRQHKTNLVLKKTLDVALMDDPLGGNVIYVAAEDCAAIRNVRLPANCAMRGITVADLDYFTLMSRSPNLCEPDEVKGFIEAVRALQLRPNIIVFDTLARATPGRSLSDPGTASAIMASLDHIKEGLECDVIVIHHPPHGGGRMLGSVIFENGADAIWRLTATRGVVDCYIEKMKNGEDDRHVFYAIQPSENGVPVIVDSSSGRRPDRADQVRAILNEVGAVDLETSLSLDELATRLDPADVAKEREALRQAAKSGKAWTKGLVAKNEGEWRWSIMAAV